MASLRWVLAAGIGALAFTAGAPHAGAAITGGCTAEATFEQGTGLGPITVDLVAPGDAPVELGASDTFSWQATSGNTAGELRPSRGRAEVDLPWPFGTWTMESWTSRNGAAQGGGTYTYELTRVVPRGATFDVIGTYEEQGLTCIGTLEVEVAGKPFDSYTTWVALGGLVVSGIALLLAGRARRLDVEATEGRGHLVAGAIAGFFAFGFLGLTLLCFGKVSFGGPWLALSLVGLVVGAIWGWWAPIGRRRKRRTTPPVAPGATWTPGATAAAGFDGPAQPPATTVTHTIEPDETPTFTGYPVVTGPLPRHEPDPTGVDLPPVERRVELPDDPPGDQPPENHPRADDPPDHLRTLVEHPADPGEPRPDDAGLPHRPT
jgi:hypothetical protein